MNKIKFVSKIILAASFSLAMAFTFSCSVDPNGDPYADPYEPKSNPSNEVVYDCWADEKAGIIYCDRPNPNPSSSSEPVVQSSSSSAPVIHSSSSSHQVTPSSSSVLAESSSSSEPVIQSSSSSEPVVQSSSSSEPVVQSSSSSEPVVQSSSSEEPKLSSSSIDGTAGLKFYSNVEVRCGNTLGNPWLDGNSYEFGDYLETAQGFSKDGNFPAFDTLHVKLASGDIIKLSNTTNVPEGSVLCFGEGGIYKGQRGLVIVGEKNPYLIDVALPDEICGR